MGIGFTVDTPLKVAKYGMDSAISLVDDILLEKLRKMYSEKFELPYQEITEKIDDFKAKRITSYLNMMSDLAEEKFEALKNVTSQKGHELFEYMNMLPDHSHLKKEFTKLTAKKFNLSELKNWASNNLVMGAIDVNIMTKIDKTNFKKKEKLPIEYNDAHASLRGFANSKLRSSVVLSAGMNPKLYAYIAQFDDFFPDAEGTIKKRIILKVSDYRSALIQGKFLAKKGLWVSEYRIESGLNCGGHAFATQGFLLGPVLEEFKEKRQELQRTIQKDLVQELEHRGRTIPKNDLILKITAQGGVGTEEEHSFLLDHYKLDSVGWGSPFLLVPEATTVDKATLDQLKEAKEDDLYLSNISPLGVPFNNLKNNTKDLEKEKFIQKGRPGSACPKKFLALNHEFDKGICTASREYQYLKLNELKDLDAETYEKEFAKITEKSCICVGLGTSSLIAHEMDTKKEGPGISVCPGPNMAYYSKEMSLKNITDHIYGRDNMVSRNDRPNFFIKELHIYMDYLKNKMDEAKDSMNKKEEKYFKTFVENMKQGVSYYQELFDNASNKFDDLKENIQQELKKTDQHLSQFQKAIHNFSLKKSL